MRIGVGRVSRALAIPYERLRGLDLREYDACVDKDAPAFFMGLYHDDDLAALIAHRGPGLQMFCGGDARHVAWAAPALRDRELRRSVRILAPKILAPVLREHGIDADVVHGVFAGDPSPFKPAPLGRNVYAYCPFDRRSQYGIATIAAVAARFPSVGFYLGRWGEHAMPFPNAIGLPAWIGQDEIVRVYEDCCCGIRTVATDGFPGTPVEMALMGRPTAHVVDVGVPWIDVAPTAEIMAQFVGLALARKIPDAELVAAARVHVSDRSFLELPAPVISRGSASRLAPAVPDRTPST